MRNSRVVCRPAGLAIVLVLVLVAIGMPSAAPAQSKDRSLPEGKPFNSPEGRFTISVPGKPKRVSQTVNGLENVGYTLEAGRGTYVVSYFDLPQGMSLPTATAIQAYVRARKGQVESEKDVQLDDLYPGKDVLVRLRGDSYSRLRLYAVRSRQYQIILDGAKKRVTSKEADAYFDSFKLE